MSSPKAILESVLTTRTVTDAQENSYPLTSEVDQGEGQLIVDTIDQNDVSSALEIGCAYGISALYISGALSSKNNPKHTIIDPFQTSQWKGIGVENLRRAGIDFFELLEEPSEFILPKLCQGGAKYDFALIDGNHTLDHTLLDFFYVDRMLNAGGFVLIDDLTFPAIKKVVRYVCKYPNYRIHATANSSVFRGSLKKRSVDGTFKAIKKLLPTGYTTELFAESWLTTDIDLGLCCSMVALQKTHDYERPWNWYEPF